MSEKTVGTHDLIELRLTLDWESEQGKHREVRHFGSYNVWRDLDLLPTPLQREILERPVGHSGAARFAAGDPAPRHDSQLVQTIKEQEFDHHFHGHEVEPQLGRFYPAGIVKRLPGSFSDSVVPLRITDMGPRSLTCDRNHPLADRELTIGCSVHEIHDAPQEHGGRCQDVLPELLHGPGMQVRAQGRPTDFFSADGFRRMDDTPDRGFYAMPRLVDHLDETALQEVAGLYGRLLPAGARVLDLMAGVNSHLAQASAPAAVTGLGMNQEELDANGALTARVIQDLNLKPELPFADDSFDAVICTASVEYLTRPLEVFAEVRRVLKRGGVFINTFSNRWFPTKAIALWSDLHEFERMGLVGEYFLRTEGFGPVDTWSQRGLKRPVDDRYSGQTPWSDPLYAVWSKKEPPQ